MKFVVVYRCPAKGCIALALTRRSTYILYVYKVRVLGAGDSCSGCIIQVNIHINENDPKMRSKMSRNFENGPKMATVIMLQVLVVTVLLPQRIVALMTLGEESVRHDSERRVFFLENIRVGMS